MRRRCITTVLILAYLAAQLAGLPHVHAADGASHSSDHSRPHVHVSWSDHEQPGHDHVHNHHHHGRADDHDEHSHGQHPEPSSRHEHKHDHDNDAVYLPDGAGSPSVVKESDTCVAAMTPFAICEYVAAAYADNSPDDLFLGECSFGCALYLALRALRL
jgi:hypothetical protein